MTMNKTKTAEWAVKRIAKFARDLAYVAPELYEEKFKLLANEIRYQIQNIQEHE